MDNHEASEIGQDDLGPDSLNVYPGYLIRRLNQISTAYFVRIISSAGLDLTPVQFASLHTIGHAPGLDQRTLASRIGHDRVTTGGAVDRLVKKGLVTRRQSVRDRRSRELFLTETGLEALRAALLGIAEIQKCTLSRLTTNEADVFTRLLKKAVGE